MKNVLIKKTLQEIAGVEGVCKGLLNESVSALDKLNLKEFYKEKYPELVAYIKEREQLILSFDKELLGENSKEVEQKYIDSDNKEYRELINKVTALDNQESNAFKKFPINSFSFIVSEYNYTDCLELICNI
jgi:hypothetical protein